jgi:hypothetical protein
MTKWRVHRVGVIDWAEAVPGHVAPYRETFR